MQDLKLGVSQRCCTVCSLSLYDPPYCIQSMPYATSYLPASRSNKRSPITGQCLPALVLRKQDLIESFDKFLVVLIRIWLRHVLTRFSARPIQQSIRLLTHPKTEHRVAFESDHLSDKVFGSPYYVRHPGYKPA